jgi:hypothetical protein
MTPYQLKELKEELASTIRIQVNGKIDKINEKLDNHMQSASEHWERSTSFMQEMLPFRDALITVRNMNKFMKWLGIPSLVALVTYWFVK